MNIQAQSIMRFGDTAGLKDFFFVHRLVHMQVDNVIAQSTGLNMPNATLDSDVALDAWVQLMGGLDPDGDAAAALLDWLQLHANLHQAEYTALNLGLAPDLSQVNFSDEGQFNDWMFAHSSVHDLLGNATGVV